MTFTGYTGEAVTKLDEKGRITIPSKIRDVMRVIGHDTWYLAPGDNNTVLMFHRDGWNDLRERVTASTSDETQLLAFQRMFFGLATDARPDPQGRMPLANHLREHARIDKEAVVVGVNDHLEVWNKEAWDAFKSKNKSLYEQMAPPLFAKRVSAAVAT
ncbi:MAG: transcriptional regulator MraZ [Candidatus Hydrogenedentota bacterium]